MEFYGTVQYRKKLFAIYWLSNCMKIQWLKSVKIVVFILFWKTVCKLVHEKLFFGARVQTLSTRYSVLLLLWSAILVQRKMFLKLKECDLGFFEVTPARIDLHKESANLQGTISFLILSFLSDLCRIASNSPLVAQSCFTLPVLRTDNNMADIKRKYYDFNKIHPFVKAWFRHWASKLFID